MSPLNYEFFSQQGYMTAFNGIEPNGYCDFFLIFSQAIIGRLFVRQIQTFDM